jgi:hypothetical protein
MRFIASPIYRAFPELDVFTDEQCRDYLQRVYGGVLARVAVGLVSLVSGVGWALAVGWVCVLVSNANPGRTTIVGVFALAAVTAAFGFGTLISRDVLLRQLVRRVLGEVGLCPSCDYSAMGLLVSVDFAVTCPECGTGIDLAIYREHCVPGIDGALRFMPPPGMVIDQRRFLTAKRRRAVAQTARRITVAFALIVGLVVLPVGALVLAESWSARSDQAARSTPEALDAALLPEGVQPSGESIAVQLGAIAHWQAEELRAIHARALDRFARNIRWGVPSIGSGGGAETAAKDLDSLQISGTAITGIAMVADRIAEGRAAPMRSPAVNTSYGKEWIRGLAASKLWQLSKVAMAAAIERRDGPAFARALEWHLAAQRIYASIPPFMVGSGHGAATVRVTAEALRADGGGELAIALEAAIRRQSVRPSMEAMKAEIVEWEVDGLAAWFTNPRGVVWPPWSDPPIKWQAESSGIHWVGLYWPQRKAIRAHAGSLFEELMADPSDRNQQKASAVVFALADAGPIAGAPFSGINGYHSTSLDLRGALLERALATVVAIERFRRSEGRLPNSLDELRPRFVDAVPKDPWRKGPFVYRVLPADPAAAWHPGYTLWSVGANGSDDDGNPVTDVVLVPAPPWPEPSAESPAHPDATLGN